MRTTAVGLLISMVLVAGGCVHVGPRTIERDNLQYGDALGESWKRQMLSNMVKLRYAGVRPAPDFGEGWTPPTIHVRVSESRPDDAFVAVPYRDHWFYIDDRGFASKRMFTFLVIAMSLAESGTAPAAPLITVGTGG